jgi:ABC-type phosphate/phosphonate transport system permease subunit
MNRLLYLLQNPRTKKAASAVLVGIGVILLLFVKRSMKKVDEAKTTVNHFNDFFTNNSGIWNPLIKFFGGQVHEEVSKYDTLLLILLILGIALVATGIITFFWHRKRPN